MNLNLLKLKIMQKSIIRPKMKCFPIERSIFWLKIQLFRDFSPFFNPNFFQKNLQSFCHPSLLSIITHSNPKITSISTENLHFAKSRQWEWLGSEKLMKRGSGIWLLPRTATERRVKIVEVWSRDVAGKFSGRAQRLGERSLLGWMHKNHMGSFMEEHRIQRFEGMSIFC